MNCKDVQDCRYLPVTKILKRTKHMIKALETDWLVKRITAFCVDEQIN